MTMAEDKKKEETKKEIKINAKQKKMLLVIGVALLVIVVGIIIAVTGKDTEDKDKEKPSTATEIKSSEETVEDEYGFTKEDAINVIKGVFNSDSYEYEATVREDNMYIVTVTNPDSDTKYAYVVDPNDGSFYEIAEE